MSMVGTFIVKAPPKVALVCPYCSEQHAMTLDPATGKWSVTLQFIPNRKWFICRKCSVPLAVGLEILSGVLRASFDLDPLSSVYGHEYKIPDPITGEDA